MDPILMLYLIAFVSIAVNLVLMVLNWRNLQKLKEGNARVAAALRMRDHEVR